MTDQLKTIVHALNEEPFKKSYNLISFDALTEEQLLQELSDVLCVIEGKAMVDIRNEGTDETALRVFGSLRVLKFKPPMDSEELSAFRQGVVEGDRQAVYLVLEWLLTRIVELQQRAYLARFLVKVDVPPEFLQEPEIEQLQDECEALMESFKAAHQQQLATKIDVSVDDVRQDLDSMEQEKEQLARRIDRLKRKADAAPQKERMLELAAQIRAETDRQTELTNQKAEQRNGLVHAEQKQQRLQQLLSEARQHAESMKPEDLIKKLEEENKIHSYMVTEKLPKEISTRRKIVQDMQKVLAQPALDQGDLDELQQKMDATNAEIERLTEERDSRSDTTEDKLSVFRHQVATVERRKERAAESLQEQRRELELLEADVRQKKRQMRDSDGNEVVTTVQFKNYVNKLRTKTSTYKKKRAELQDLRAEIGVLARTDEIFKGQLDELKQELESRGQPFIAHVDDDSSKPQRPQTAKPRNTDMQQLKDMVRGLENQINERKQDFTPLFNQVRPLREQYQTMSDSYLSKKQQFDASAASLESGYSRLEQEVKVMRADVTTADCQYHRLTVLKKVLEYQLERANSDAAGGGFRSDLQTAIQRAETEQGELQTTAAAATDEKAGAARQMKLWRDLARLMECKRRCATRQQPPVAAAAASLLHQSSRFDRRLSTDTMTSAHEFKASSIRRRPVSRRGSVMSDHSFGE